MEGTRDKVLSGCRIAILATDGFEQVELFEARRALLEAGAEVEVVSPKRGSIRGWHFADWGKSIGVDAVLGAAQAVEYDALMIPGGVMSPDRLRSDQLAVEFVRSMILAGKPIAAICHGPWVLIETGVTQGRRMTSWPSLKTDLINAGATWVNEEVVVDSGLVTSRMPQDIPAFNKSMIGEFAVGASERRSRRMQAQPLTPFI